MHIYFLKAKTTHQKRSEKNYICVTCHLDRNSYLLIYIETKNLFLGDRPIYWGEAGSKWGSRHWSGGRANGETPTQCRDPHLDPATPQ